MLYVPHGIIETDAKKGFWHVSYLLGVIHLLMQVFCRYLRKQSGQFWDIVLHQTVIRVEPQHIVVIGEVRRDAPSE